MNKIPFDDNPEYRGLINFASNGVENMLDAFNYGFKLGWQTCWREHNPDSPTAKELDLLTKAQGEAVRGFVNYCQYDTDSVERITDYGVNQLQGIADYYLTQQSLEKGEE